MFSSKKGSCGCVVFGHLFSVFLSVDNSGDYRRDEPLAAAARQGRVVNLCLVRSKK